MPPRTRREPPSPPSHHFSSNDYVLPNGPSCVDDIFSWPSQFCSQLADSGATNLIARLLSNLCLGLLVCTDYSGIGGVEIALFAIAAHCASAYDVKPMLRFWSASDLLPYCRDILMDDRGVGGGRASNLHWSYTSLARDTCNI